MIELQNILHLWEKSKSNNQSCVLATVVKTQGSSYRLPGARMLLNPLGEHAGSISGGCLEEDLVKKAWWLTESGPVIRRYDTTPDGEISSTGYGLGCNGIIHVLLERVTSVNCAVLDLLQEVRQSRKPATVTHVLSPIGHVGTRFDVGPDERWEEVYVEHLSPPIQLLLCGAGDDAIPLNRLAQFLGWQVLVFDGRSHYARPERFPGAQVTVRPLDIPLQYPHDPWTVAAIMTHSYSQDKRFLEDLRGLNLPYLGVLGPQKRTRQLLQDLGLSGTEHEAELHAPMGLDIGADGPEQVALAVVSEIQASLNRRLGGQLRQRAGSIHASAEQIDGLDDKGAYILSYTCV